MTLRLELTVADLPNAYIEAKVLPLMMHNTLPLQLSMN